MLFIVLNATGHKINLIQGGRSNYSIDVAQNSPELELKAAKVLQDYVKKISGAELPLTGKSSNPKVIMIGKIAAGLSPEELKRTGKDGFWIINRNDKIIIAGNTPKGTLYGVYTFLEKYLGCRWYTSQAEKVPKQKDVVIEVKDELQKPVLLYRESGHENAYHDDFADKLKLNNGKIISRTQLYENGKVGELKKGGFGLWVHSSFALVPPHKYFKTHPEYYALRGDKRQTTQLCFSNPEVFEIVVKELKKRMAKNPKDLFWDISQQDNGKYCQCSKCAETDKREGSHIGSILQFINKVAEVFPDKIITTLAYQYSVVPPEHLRPRSNVGIILCYFTDKRDYLPLKDSDRGDAAGFRKYLAGWKKICNKVIIWDYLTNYTHYLMPDPNLDTISPNFKFYVQNNCIGIYAAANSDRGGSLWALRNYLVSKLLWNPNEDPKKITDDFLDGYYGKAAPYIREYINLMHKTLAKSKLFISIYGRPSEYANSYLSADMLSKYNQLFDQAEDAVKDQKEQLARVKETRLSLMYAQLLLKWGSVDQRLKIADEFFRTAEKNGVVIFGERRNISWFKDLVSGKLAREQELLSNPIGSATGKNAKSFTINLSEPAFVNQIMLQSDYINNFTNKRCRYEVHGLVGTEWKNIYRSICSFVSRERRITITPLCNALNVKYDDKDWKNIEFPDKNWRRMPNAWQQYTEQEKHQDMSSAPAWFSKKVVLSTEWKKQDIILELGRDGVYADDDVMISVFWNGYLLNNCWSENMKSGWYRAAPILFDKPEYGWPRTRHYCITPEMLADNGENQLTVWVAFADGPHGLIEGPVKLLSGDKLLDLKGTWKMKNASDLPLQKKISKLQIRFDCEVSGTFRAFIQPRIVTFCGIVLPEPAAPGKNNYLNYYNEGMELYKTRKYDLAVVKFAMAANSAINSNDKYNSMFQMGRCMEKMKSYSGATNVYKTVWNLPSVTQDKKSNAFIQYISNLYWDKKYKEVVATAETIIADSRATDKMKLKSCDLGYLAARNLRQYEKSFNFAREAAEYDKSPEGHWRARSLILQSEALRKLKKYKEAAAMLPDNAIQKMPPDRQGDAYIQRSTIYESQGKYDEAIKELKRASEVAQNSNIIKTAKQKMNNLQKNNQENSGLSL